MHATELNFGNFSYSNRVHTHVLEYMDIVRHVGCETLFTMDCGPWTVLTASFDVTESCSDIIIIIIHAMALALLLGRMSFAACRLSM